MSKYKTLQISQLATNSLIMCVRVDRLNVLEFSLFSIFWKQSAGRYGCM